MPAFSSPLLADYISVKPRFGRSVHLERDLAVSTSSNGYFLTTSALEALQGVLRAQATPADRALSLIGPYGAGKSAFAAFLARLTSDAAFRSTVQLPATVGTEVPQLLPIPVVGSRSALAPALLAALRHALATAAAALPVPAAVLTAESKPTARNVANAYVAVAEVVAAKTAFQGLLLLVDEAGKFLEYAANHAQEGDIFVLQELAEAAARAPQHGQLWVITIMHQNAEAYAHRLGRTQQGEWAKVAQRFRQLPLFPSDVERMDLIGRALEHQPTLYLNGTFSAQLAPVMSPTAQLLPTGLADRFPDLARAAYPLHPVTLLALPALFRRAGQSHRSVFNFLEGQESSALGRFLQEQPYNVADPAFFRLDRLFDYGRDVLLAHYTGPTARPWHEAVEIVEQSVAKNPPLSELAVRLLKCVALLSWLRESRLPASPNVLAAALGPETPEAIAELERRSLIVWSRTRGSFRLWEGGDVDVAAELTAARATLTGDVLLLAANDPALFALPRLVARRHAFRTGTLRPVGVEVLRPDMLLKRGTERLADLSVLLCLASDETAEFYALATAQSLAQPNLLVAVATETEALREAAYDLAAARVVLEHVPALHGDRAARRELALRRHESETLFRSEWSRLFGPAMGAEGGLATEASVARWYSQGTSLLLPDARSFSRQLSILADNTFRHTPVLRNELLNRRQLSSAGAAARGALVKAMLDRGEFARLGFVGFPPEYAMYASVLHAPGLHYRTEEGTWAWRSPADTPDDLAQLRPVWQAIERLVFESTRPVVLPDLYAHLRAAPYGVSEGMLPVLVALFRRVYAGDTSLYREGNFLAEEKEADWELLLRRPDMFALADSRVSGARRAVVERIAQSTGVLPQLVPVVRRLLRMLDGLPDYTKQTRRLPEAALALRDAFQESKAPEHLLFYAAPVALGLPPLAADAPADPARLEHFFTGLNTALQAWSAAYPAVREEGRDALLQACGLPAGSESWQQLHQRLQQLPHPAQVLVPLVTRCASNDAEADLDRVLALVANRPLERWRDVELAALPSYLAPIAAALRTAWDAEASPAAPVARKVSLTSAERKQATQLRERFVSLARPAGAPAVAPHVLRAAVLQWLEELDQEF